jgi:hypothetical protein
LQLDSLVVRETLDFRIYSFVLSFLINFFLFLKLLGEGKRTVFLILCRGCGDWWWPQDWRWWRRNAHTWRLWKAGGARWWRKRSWLVVESEARTINILCRRLWLHRWLPRSVRHRHHSPTTCWRHRNWCVLIPRCRVSRFLCIEGSSFESHSIAALTVSPRHIICIASIIDRLIQTFIILIFSLVFYLRILLLSQTKLNQLIINRSCCLCSG